MSEGWQLGDLAVCVDGDHECRSCLDCDNGDAAEDGNVYTVVEIDPPTYSGDSVGLRFAGDPPDEFYCGNAWQKIRPDEQEACEPEFVTLIKRAKRTVTA